MREIRMTEVLRRSLSRAITILFKPFNFKKWLLLIFIAICAGSFSLGGNVGGGNDKAKREAHAETVQTTNAAGQQSSTTQAPAKPAPIMPPKIVINVITGIVLFLISAFLLYAWVVSRFSFVWFNAVASNDASIVEPFHRHRMQGRSLFLVSIMTMIILGAVIFSLIAWGIVRAGAAGAFNKDFIWSFAAAMRLFGTPAALLLLTLILGGLFSVAVYNFIIIMMAVDKTTFIPAWRKLCGIYRNNILDIIVFHLVLLLISIVGFIIVGLLAFAVTILFVIMAAVFIGVGYAVIVGALKAMPAFIIYCVIVGTPLLAAFLVSICCVELPFSVFLRAFGIEYLCALNCGYSYEMLDVYSKERCECRSRSAIAIPIVLCAMIWIILIIAILAAIAVPNFIKARDTALKNKNKSAAVNSILHKGGEK